MKILHVIAGLDVGGAERMLARLVTEQVAAAPDMKCTVVSLTTIGAVGTELRNTGVEFVALGIRSVADVVKAVFRLRRLMDRSRPDIVQTWMVHSDLIGGVAARMAGIPAVVWGVRTTDFSLTPMTTRGVRWICARLSRTVPHTIVCAAHAARRAQAAAGYDPDRMVVIPNGFDVEALRPTAEARRRMRQQLGIEPGVVLVGCVGRYNPAKDHANFVAAAGKVAAARPDLRFVMIGRGVDDRNAELMSLIGATGLRERFLLLSERSDICDCLNAMDVFVLPSRSEAFPNVVGEAMAVGVPCAVTDVGDAAALVGETGIVVAPADPEALADAIAKLASLAPAERHALGQRARARISIEYSMPSVAARFSDLYERIVNDTRRRAPIAN